MSRTATKLESTAEDPFIDAARLAAAASDPARVDSEVKKWKKNPEKYIEKNYARIVEYDFPVFAGANIWITGKQGRRVNLLFNRVQRQLWKWFLEDLAAGRPVRWYIIKARQMGVSTFFLALYYWLTGLRPNRNTLIATHDESSVNTFNQRFRSMHHESHELLRSPTILDRRDAVVFGNKTTARQAGAGVGLNSRVIFATAGRDELGRSDNYHMVLLSEFAIWPDLGIDVAAQMGALNQTIPKLPGTIVIRESTAKGHNEAKRMWDDPEDGYRKIFIPWVAFDEYRRPRQRPLGDLCGTDEEGGRTTRFGNELEEARIIRDALEIWYTDEIAAGGEEWLEKEIESRLNWRRYTINEDCNGDIHTFRREYPTTPGHAFANRGRHVFDSNSLELMRLAVKEEAIKPLRFAYVHNPEVLDPNTKFQVDPYGSLRIYRTPEAGQAYVIGVDPAMGIPNSGDPSALVVLSVPDLEEVASFAEIVTPDRFGELVYYLGMIFNTALVGVENNERGGYAINLKLAREMHYPRLYYRFDPFDKKAASKPGYATTETNKSVNVAMLQQLIRDHEILFRTDEVIDQLQHYMLLENGDMGAAADKHDDLVSAALIACHLSTKIHLYGAASPVAPKGSFSWWQQKHEQRRRPGLFGYR
jgi:hypothetical protein